MALTLYRRHNADCRKALRKLKLATDEMRSYQKCACPIWVTGTTAKERVERESMKTRDWDVAEAKVETKLRAAKTEVKEIAVHGFTIQDSIKSFLAGHEDSVRGTVLVQYGLILGRLQTLAHSRHKVYMEELTVDLLENFKTQGLKELKTSTSKANAVSKLKFFLREAFRRGWIKEALAERVKSIKAARKQTQPYAEKELAMFLTQAAEMKCGKYGYATIPATFRLLLDFMNEVGLRVGDAIRYDPANCVKSNRLWKYTFESQKQRKTSTPQTATVYLPEKLKLDIDNAKWFSAALPFAFLPIPDDNADKTQEQAVYQRMQVIGKRCGVTDYRPHRLRHTFAVRLLVKGVRIADVSKALYHSLVAITEKFYAPWVTGREERQEQVMADALAA